MGVVRWRDGWQHVGEMFVPCVVSIHGAWTHWHHKECRFVTHAVIRSANAPCTICPSLFRGRGWVRNDGHMTTTPQASFARFEKRVNTGRSNRCQIKAKRKFFVLSVAVNTSIDNLVSPDQHLRAAEHGGTTKHYFLQPGRQHSNFQCSVSVKENHFLPRFFFLELWSRHLHMEHFLKKTKWSFSRSEHNLYCLCFGAEQTAQQVQVRQLCVDTWALNSCASPSGRTSLISWSRHHHKLRSAAAGNIPMLPVLTSPQPTFYLGNRGTKSVKCMLPLFTFSCDWDIQRWFFTRELRVGWTRQILLWLDWAKNCIPDSNQRSLCKIHLSFSCDVVLDSKRGNQISFSYPVGHILQVNASGKCFSPDSKWTLTNVTDVIQGL